MLLDLRSDATAAVSIWGMSRRVDGSLSGLWAFSKSCRRSREFCSIWKAADLESAISDVSAVGNPLPANLILPFQILAVRLLWRPLASRHPEQEGTE